MLRLRKEVLIRTYDGKKKATTVLKKSCRQNRELSKMKKFYDGGDGERLLSAFDISLS